METRYKLFLYTSFLIFLLIPFNLFAQFNYDTLETNKVGPGVTHYKINETTLPWAINLLEVDLKNPFVKIETVKSFDKSAAGRERTTSMAARKNAPDHWVVGAVNGDFFNLTTGGVNNIQIANGEIVRRERPDYPGIGFNSFNNVFLGKASYSGKLIFKNSSINITGINDVRSDDALISYNSFHGSSTGTSNAGTEILLNPINYWLTNDTVYAIVDSLSVSDGSMNLSSGKMVLSASGNYEQALTGNISKGDTVKVLLNFLPGISKMDQMLGGHPLIVTNGAVANMDPNDGLVFNRHPRTAVGINQDTSKLFIIVVDGRQPLISVGMTLFELADYMISLGATSAMNLDGGGSSTMVVRSSIENSPSDGSERTVANALMVVSTAPVGSINHIKISPPIVRMFIGGIQQFTLSGSDEYFNPVTLSPSLVQYSLSNPSLGFINNSGLFSASSTAGSGYVIVHYGELKDSISLTVKGVGRLDVLPVSAVTDNSQIINFSAKVFDTDSIEQQVNAIQITWVVTDTSVGKIDAAGQFSGMNEGTTQVIASYMGKSDTANVFVEIGKGVVILDSMDSIQQWILSGVNIDSTTMITYSTEQRSTGEGSLRLDYSFKYETGKFNWVYLSSDLDIFGIPDSMLVDVFSDGRNHRIFFDFEDASANMPRTNTNKIANKAGVFETIKGKLPSTSSSIVYPLKLNRIAVALGSTSVVDQQYSGTIYFDNLRLRYKNEVTDVKDEKLSPGDFILYQNYPNPFNPVTKIKYKIPESGYTILKVYDILGNEVSKLVNQETEPGLYEINFDGGSFASGVYFYTLFSGGFIQTKKLTLLK